MLKLKVLAALLASTLLYATSLAALAAVGGSQVAPAESDVLAMLAERKIDARDLKTLTYVENAHGQLEEWSARLYGRLGLELGPRDSDPILDGRAELQVRKIAYTYSAYTQNPALSQALKLLADAERQRVLAVRQMIKTGPDAERWEAVNAPVERLMTHLRNWSEER